jgi:outer membrane lipoprotein SlyB
MKVIFGSLALLGIVGMASITTPAPVEAKGCIKGAIVGGAAGHLAHHGVAGAVAGCVIGHHEAAKKAREQHDTATQH